MYTIRNKTTGIFVGKRDGKTPTFVSRAYDVCYRLASKCFYKDYLDKEDYAIHEIVVLKIDFDTMTLEEIPATNFLVEHYNSEWNNKNSRSPNDFWVPILKLIDYKGD